MKKSKISPPKFKMNDKVWYVFGITDSKKYDFVHRGKIAEAPEIDEEPMFGKVHNYMITDLDEEYDGEGGAFLDEPNIFKTKQEGIDHFNRKVRSEIEKLKGYLIKQYS